MTNYIYLFFDTVSELPFGTVSSPFEPEKFVEITNRQCMQQPMRNMDTTDIYCVGSFDVDLGKNPPFQFVGNLNMAVEKLEELKNAKPKHA